MNKLTNINFNKWNTYIKLVRADKPIGILLLLWPTYWALWLASFGKPNTYILIIFTINVIILRTAGCIINDLIDRKLDIYVTRTKNRPLATGEITPKNAKILCLILIIIAFLLVLTLNKLTIYLSFIALLLICIYPFIKRKSYFPQIILGIAFGWSILMVYASINQTFPLECWLLFIVNILWSIIYDTQYAMIDRIDDIKIGIKSTAIIFGQYNQIILGILQILMLLILVYIGQKINLGICYFLSLLLVLCLFIYQQKLMMNNQSYLYFKAFINNKYVGLSIFLGIVLSNL